ncbi:DUF4153 domain-containing protein [Porticoccaceae bacterium LTM1]|nr:DUF4153 domain-containing protein [Porticoccaceae bacterium LTM1]
MATPHQIPAFSRKLLILIALIQGLSLYLLYRAHTDDFWPATQPVFYHLLLSVVLVTPTLLLLALTDDNRKKLLWIAGGVTILTALFSSYIGWQLQPDDIIPQSNIRFIYYATLTLFLYKVTMYSQAWTSDNKIRYGALFQYSWRNTILIALCLLFTLLFWGILFLWGTLFDAIGISFFEDLFEEEWFLFPTLSLAYGLAFTIFRKLVHILDTLARVLKALCQFLLPVLTVVALLFLITLPFVGLSALWDTGRGTGLVLWLQALLLFLVNAVYQDEKLETPYWLPLHRLIYICIGLSPIFSLIAGYGLYLRVEQYGLTVERCWAILVWSILALFVFSYCWSIIRRRDNWVAGFATINVRMGVLVLALMVLVNTPVLEFRKLSLNSQLARLDSGELTLEKLDLRYIAHNLGRPGYLALETLKEGQDQRFVNRVTDAYRHWRNQPPKMTAEETLSLVEVFPKGSTAPSELLAQITESENQQYSIRSIQLLSVDLNNDNSNEWVQLNYYEHWLRAKMWYLSDGIWSFEDMGNNLGPVPKDFEQVRNHIELNKEISTAPEEWQKLKIGDIEFRVSN